MEIKAIFKSVCGLMTVVAFIACSGNGIEGKWVEPSTWYGKSNARYKFGKRW